MTRETFEPRQFKSPKYLDLLDRTTTSIFINSLKPSLIVSCRFSSALMSKNTACEAQFSVLTDYAVRCRRRGVIWKRYCHSFSKLMVVETGETYGGGQYRRSVNYAGLYFAFFSQNSQSNMRGCDRKCPRERETQSCQQAQN